MWPARLTGDTACVTILSGFSNPVKQCIYPLNIPAITLSLKRKLFDKNTFNLDNIWGARVRGAWYTELLIEASLSWIESRSPHHVYQTYWLEILHIPRYFTARDWVLSVGEVNKTWRSKVSSPTRVWFIAQNCRGTCAFELVHFLILTN